MPIEELEELRGKIDAVDAQMLALFEERMRLAAQIAEVKRAGNISVTDNARESRVLEAAAKAVDESVRGEAIELMRTLMELSKLHQERKLFGALPQPPI